MKSYALHRLWRLIATRPGVFALCLLIATVGLWLTLLLGTLGRVVWPYATGAAANTARVAPEISVFAASGTSAQDLKSLQFKLETSVGVNAVQLIARDAAWAELSQRGALAGQLGELKTNPLPDVFVLRLAPDVSTANLDALVASIKKMPRVDAVEANVSWYRKARAVARLVLGLGGAAVAAALLCVSLGLVAAMRLFTAASATELRVLQLVGADAAFTRRPFVLAGALCFALSAAAAIVLTWLTLRPFGAEVAALAEAYQLPLALRLPELPWLAGFVLAAFGLGWVVARLTVKPEPTS